MKEWKWYLADLNNVEKNGLKVFTTFSCGGGSSFGYKLAGCDVIGNLEIDKNMNELYIANHHLKYSFNIDIRDFNKLADSELPRELFCLDILDGSPPCSTFSMAGNREKDWGRKKKFAEGQQLQTLDDLFFCYIDTAARLRPKVVVAENVKGLILGKAKGYVNEILKRFKEAGYKVQLFLLNSALMGVPQARERVFFIARREDLGWPDLRLSFYKKSMPFKEVEAEVENVLGKPIAPNIRKYFFKTPAGKNLSYVHPRGSYFNCKKVHPEKVCPTVTATEGDLLHYKEPYYLSDEIIICLQTFPQDYDFKGRSVKYVCGMSVPPLMMKEIAGQIVKQWFKRRKEG